MFGGKLSIIAVVHALPLPGSHGYQGNMQKILEAALNDARIYKDEGVDAILVENMHDVPYICGYAEPETVAAMAVLCQAVKSECRLPTGLQILAGANLEALGVAVASDLDFIRVEGFVYAHVGDEGLHQSCAAQLLRRRSALKAEAVQIFADIKKKHSSHAITGDVSLIETARAAEFFGADGVIVTGEATAMPAEIDEVRGVAAAVSNKVLVGSGVTPENVKDYLPMCDGLIVGSCLKFDGKWNNHVDAERVKKLLDRVKA